MAATFSNLISLSLKRTTPGRLLYARHVRSSTFPRNWVQINVIHPMLRPRYTWKPSVNFNTSI